MELVEKFLELFKKPFVKLELHKVRLLRKEMRYDEKEYYSFIGLFSVEVKDDFAALFGKFIEHKREILSEVGKHIDDESAVFRKKFVRKIRKDGETDKWRFDYAFDFNPSNLVDFRIGKKKDKIYLFVRGYGSF